MPESSVNNASADTRVSVSVEELRIGEIYEWAVHSSCGAVVVFSGTVRDHAEGRTDVTHLTYEAYEDKAVARMNDIVAEARTQWPTIVRVALLHRVARLGLGESSVVVAVSSPHRPEAFEAARYCIDALKVAVPIWKQEEWSDGSDWGTGSHEISSVPTAQNSVAP